MAETVVGDLFKDHAPEQISPSLILSPRLPLVISVLDDLSLCMERTTFTQIAERAAAYPLVWRRSQISRLPYLLSSQSPRQQARPPAS